MKTRRLKKCKNCKKSFQPYNSLQSVCGIDCSIVYANLKIKQKALKKARKDKKEGNEALMTNSDWKQKFQTIFNKFIRLRDLNRGCVSCETPLQNRKYDAGHYYPTTYEGLRFDERNVHGQCVTCNQYKHGNLHEYKKRITNRITVEDLVWLDENRHRELKMSIPEIKTQIEIYKLKVKNHENK